MSQPIHIDPEGNLVLKIKVVPVLKALLALGLAAGAGLLPIEHPTPASRICLMIFVGAAALWITEAIPPFATAIMVIVLNVYLLGKAGVEDSQVNYQIFLNPIASPVLVLFFGGFILAVAATKHGLDTRLARAFIKPFGTRPSMVLLGVICTTALFSMFMSNTATTAMMIAILAPIFSRFEGRDPFKKALVLAVPFAANIGGMGTMIGTPPNAVAASMLAQLGHPISFFRWMLFGVPIVLVLLAILWMLLLLIFRPRKDRFEILFPEPLVVTWDLACVVVTFSVVVLLWLTENLHGVPAAVVALIPVMIFTTFGIIDRSDLREIDWDVLILVAGGMTLGVGMTSSGLSNLIVSKITFFEAPAMAMLAAFMLLAVLLSNFMSHTSAANIMIPLMASITTLDPRMAIVAVALATSLAMSMPISTPPNAIAFATRAIGTRDMARCGTLVSLAGLVVTMAFLALFRTMLSAL